MANYGGALFFFPPVSIPDIWRDRALDFTETLEERLLAAACSYSACPHIALLSAAPPGAGWRRLAQRYRKKWVHLPLSQFSDATLQQLRMDHQCALRTVPAAGSIDGRDISHQRRGMPSFRHAFTLAMRSDRRHLKGV